MIAIPPKQPQRTLLKVWGGNDQVRFDHVIHRKAISSNNVCLLNYESHTTFEASHIHGQDFSIVWKGLKERLPFHLPPKATRKKEEWKEAGETLHINITGFFFFFFF